MRIVHRLIGALLLTSLAATPLGVAAEGYVCAFSGARMTPQAQAACTQCAPAKDAAPARSFERPCCVYVGATALPPVLSVANIALAAPARTAAVVPPGMTITVTPAQPLPAQLEIDTSPQNIRLVEAVQLRN
jgi:hypothetical protein